MLSSNHLLSPAAPDIHILSICVGGYDCTLLGGLGRMRYLYAMHLPDFATSDDLWQTPKTHRHHEPIEQASTQAAAATCCLHQKETFS